MDALTGYFPHQSVPVETDERMTFSSVELARPPPVQQHQGRTEALSRLQDRGGDVNAVWRLPEAPEWHFTKTHPGQMNSPHTALARPPGRPELALRSLPDPVACYSLRSAGPSNWPEECSGSLEPPLPLLSDVNSNHDGPARHPAASRPGQCSRPEHRRHVGHLPLNPLPHRCSCHDKQNYPVNVRHTPGAYRPSWNFPQKKLPSSEAAGSWCGRPPHDVVHEVSINPPLQKEPAWETRRTISLPEECRNIFITYSVDVAREMPSFTTFLADHGFKPAIDIFDNPLRRLDTTKWMDRYLNDESVLIIVAISPKYKEDVAGVGNDEHGLHTKYIHNQLQNEFIQQGSLNFRLVPVLFPPATKDHVPRWLRSTSIYRWNLVSTQDTQDLLLRLLREERYVIPKPRSSLTLTVRPV